MSKPTSVGKNLAYQSAYQILAVITPLVTAPYVSRMLGAKGLGEYSFAWTNALYFSLFSMLGVANYGCREIAKVQGDKEKRSLIFWNIYVIQIFMTCLMLVLYVLYVYLEVKDNSLLAFTQIFVILGCFFDINWYFVGIEKFKITVTRNIVIKILTVFSVLLFVNKTTGTIGYSLVMSLGTFFSDIVLIPFLHGEVILIKPTWRNIKLHIQPNIILFIPVLASSIFHIMDKTMLGILSGSTQLGYYVNADKVVNIPIGIIVGFGTVYLPRISAMRNDEDEICVQQELYRSLEVHSIIISALSFGLAGIAIEFTPFFFGPGFEPCSILVISLIPAFFVKAYSNYVRSNILIPYGKDKQYTVAVVTGAVVNLLSNFYLIPQFKALGAIIGTVLAEIIVFIFQLYKLPIKMTVKEITRHSSSYIIFGIIMYLFMRACALLYITTIIKIIIETVVGGGMYIICCCLYWKVRGVQNPVKPLFH